jgi:uracil-DNA glycosylase
MPNTQHPAPSTLDALLQEIEAEARRAPFPIDEPVYEQARRDPHVPVLFAGSLAARVCSFGRDLGRDEVRWAQPQVGAAGREVRSGVLRALGEAPDPGDKRLEAALHHILLSNTVPFKPPGNKAYPDRVKERFRPFVARFLAEFWQGDHVVTLGTEAFMWFEPYCEPGALAAFWKREDRYEADLPCVLRAATPSGPIQRALTLGPLPHPSPLNQRWVAAFPGLLDARLRRAGLAGME